MLMIRMKSTLLFGNSCLFLVVGFMFKCTLWFLEGIYIVFLYFRCIYGLLDSYVFGVRFPSML